MFVYTGKHCFIEELTTRNEEDLFILMDQNREEYFLRVNSLEIPSSFLEFKKEIVKWFRRGRNYQFLIYKKDSPDLLGTIFLYDLNQKNSTIEISCYFKPLVSGWVIIESFWSIFIFIRTVLYLENIFFSIYQDNVRMRKIVGKLGLFSQDSLISNLSEKVIEKYYLDKKSISSLVKKFERFSKE